MKPLSDRMRMSCGDGPWIVEVIALETRIQTLEGKLLHASSHDCIRVGDGEHGEERVWESLTDEQRAWWVAQATRPEGEEGMTRETDDLERRQCNVCGEYWVDTGDTVCPFCHSDNTEPMVSDIDADESQ